MSSALFSVPVIVISMKELQKKEPMMALARVQDAVMIQRSFKSSLSLGRYTAYSSVPEVKGRQKCLVSLTPRGVQ